MSSSPSSTVTERVERALADYRAGKLIVLTDDEGRENEGDLCVAAQFCDREAVNFMAKHGRGLICLALPPEKTDALGLKLMVEDNRASRSTAFTVSIEAREGVSTGISAKDRAHTIATAIAKGASSRDIVSPGHVFPLIARPGGVLQRTGHTEGSLDLAILAGLEPAAVICEIMRDDGSMARYPDLLEFVDKHELSMVSIADLVEYRLAREEIVEEIATHPFVRGAQAAQLQRRVWQARVFSNKVDDRKFVACAYGTLTKSPTLVRVHRISPLYDVIEASSTTLQGKGEREVHGARAIMDRIEAAGSGVVLFVEPSGSLLNDLSRAAGSGTSDEAGITHAEQGRVLREYGIGAQVLRALGLEAIRLVTHQHRRIPSLEGYGLSITEQIVV